MALNKDQADKVKKQLLEQLSKFPEEQVKALKQQIENASPEQLERFISNQESDDGKCLFCEIAAGRVETIKLYDDQAIVVMMDISPASLGHIIMIPKQHYQFIFQAPDEVLWDLIKTAKMIIPSLVNIVKARGFNILISQGNAAGQRVDHFSVNLIPRFENDDISFDWKRKAIIQEQKAIAEKIKEAFSKIKEEKEEKSEKKEEKVQEERAEKNITAFPTRMP